MTVAEISQVVNEDECVPIRAENHTWRKVRLQRTHGDLTKFDSKEDPDFLKVLSCINQCFEAANYQRALERHSLFFNHMGRSCLGELSGTSTNY